MPNQYRGVHEEKDLHVARSRRGLEIARLAAIRSESQHYIYVNNLDMRMADRHIYLEVHRVLSLMRRWCIVAMAMAN